MSFGKFAGYFAICLVITLLLFAVYSYVQGKTGRGEPAFIKDKGNALKPNK